VDVVAAFLDGVGGCVVSRFVIELGLPAMALVERVVGRGEREAHALAGAALPRLAAVLGGGGRRDTRGDSVLAATEALAAHTVVLPRQRVVTLHHLGCAGWVASARQPPTVGEGRGPGRLRRAEHAAMGKGMCARAGRVEPGTPWPRSERARGGREGSGEAGPGRARRGCWRSPGGCWGTPWWEAAALGFLGGWARCAGWAARALGPAWVAAGLARGGGEELRAGWAAGMGQERRWTLGWRGWGGGFPLLLFLFSSFYLNIALAFRFKTKHAS
jgi:hypothetical protein